MRLAPRDAEARAFARYSKGCSKSVDQGVCGRTWAYIRRPGGPGLVAACVSHREIAFDKSPAPQHSSHGQWYIPDGRSNVPSRPAERLIAGGGNYRPLLQRDTTDDLVAVETNVGEEAGFNDDD